MAHTCKKLCATLNEFHKGKDTKEDHQPEQAMSVKECIYLDSATLSHMMNKLDWLEDYEDLSGSVKVRNGVKLNIKGKGSLPLSIKTENGTIDYKVANILYIPELLDTLISIGEIAKEEHKVTFKSNAIKI